MIYKPKAVGLARQSNDSPAAEPVSPPKVEHAPAAHYPQPPVHVNFHADNRETLEAIGRQNANIDKLAAVLQELSKKMGTGSCLVTVEDWTPQGRIKTVKITRS